MKNFKANIIKARAALKSVLLISLLTLLSSSIFVPRVNAASATFPLNLRASNAAEISGMEAVVLPTILPQSGSPINSGFTETSHTIHTGRAWTGDIILSELPECVTDINLSIIGNMTITHVANDTDPLPTLGDEPEAGVTWADGNNNLIGTVVSDVEFAVGSTLNVVSTSVLPTTVATLNSGIKILFYVETRDEVSQDGAQASFSYSGIPEIQVDYDDSDCGTPVIITEADDVPVEPGNSSATTDTPATPKSGILNPTRIVIIMGIASLILGIALDIKKHKKVKKF